MSATSTPNKMKNSKEVLLKEYSTMLIKSISENFKLKETILEESSYVNYLEDAKREKATLESKVNQLKENINGGCILVIQELENL